MPYRSGSRKTSGGGCERRKSCDFRYGAPTALEGRRTKTCEGQMTKIPTRRLTPLADRGPLRVLFAITSMPVGGAETLLVNLCRRFNGDRIVPAVCCLKERGPLGEFLAQELP